MAQPGVAVVPALAGRSRPVAATTRGRETTIYMMLGAVIDSTRTTNRIPGDATSGSSSTASEPAATPRPISHAALGQPEVDAARHHHERPANQI